MKKIKMKIHACLERWCVDEYVRLHKLQRQGQIAKPRWWFRLVSKLEFVLRPRFKGNI